MKSLEVGENIDISSDRSSFSAHDLDILEAITIDHQAFSSTVMKSYPGLVVLTHKLYSHKDICR